MIGFWGMLGALTLVRRALDPRGPAGIATPAVLITLAEYGLWAALTPAVFALARRLPLEREAWIRRLALHLALAIGVAALVELVSHAVLPSLLFPEEAFGRRGPPRISLVLVLLRLRFLDELVIYLAVLAAGFARDYFLRYRERQAEAARLQAEAARLQAQLSEARLSALRMQLNPHFLFNTLHAISALVERDPAGVRTMVARLSGLLRHVLEGSASQEVPLRDELAFLRGYLDIQRVRFQSRLEVVEDVAPEVLDALVPNLLLQPLVENAVEHGVSRLEGIVGRIEVCARRERGDDGNDRLVLAVRDNGPGTDASTQRGRAGGLGLRNTQDRLAALYGAEAALTLRSGPEGGFVAEVALPYHTAADLRAVHA